MKPRIAIIINGGIGVGSPGLEKGIPILLSFFEALSRDNDLVVFSLWPINRRILEVPYEVIAPQKPLSLLQKFAWLHQNISKRKNEIDIIHALWGYPQGMFCALLKYRFRKPVIIHLQGGDSTFIKQVGYGIYRSAIHRWMMNWSYSRADKLVVLTNFQKEELNKFYKKKVPRVIPFGLSNTGKRVSDKKLHSPVQFIHIGDINKIKDQKTLLDAFKSIKEEVNARLSIVGIDTLGGEVHAYAEKIGVSDSVSFEGVLSNEKVLKTLSQSDIMLHSSIYESQAIAIVEAITAGIPVCSTHVGIAADLSDDITLTCPVGDSKAMAENALRLISNENDYFDRVRRGMDWSRNNSMTDTVSKFNDIYTAINMKYDK